MNDAILKDSFLRGRMHGADPLGTKISGIKWVVSGGASFGLRIPHDIDFSDFEKGLMCHSLMHRLMYQLFRRHDGWAKIDRLIEYTLSQPFREDEAGRLPCYEGLIGTIRSHMPDMEEEILDSFGRYPKMQIRDRIELSDLFMKARSLEEIEVLQHSKYAGMFPGAIRYTLKNWRQRYHPTQDVLESESAVN